METIVPQEWVGVRELGRRVGRKHRAVQRAIQEGRIPAAAVRRDARGRVVAIEYHGAALAWDRKTDFDRALRSAEPLRLPPAAVPVQTSAPLDPYDAEALRFHPALEVALMALPAALAREGLDRAVVERVLEHLYQVMTGELRQRQEPEEFIAHELDILRDMIANPDL